MPKFLDDIIFINSQGKECSVNEYYNNMNQFETKLNTEISERKSFDDSHNNVENGTGADSIVQKVSTIDPTNPADFENTATANGGVAFGKSNTNNGANAIITGWGNINNTDNALVIGQLNKLNEDAVFAIGNGVWLNGAASPSRSDAFKILKDGSTIIGGVDIDNNDATLPDYQVTPNGWLGFDSTVIKGDQNLAAGARNYIRGNYNITSGLFNTIFSTEIQKDKNGNEKLDGNGNPIPELVNRSLAIGSKNQVRNDESAAIGDRNVVTGGNSVALAYKNKVYADASVALGHSNTIGNKDASSSKAQGSVAAGHGNTLTGDASFAANYGNTVSGYCGSVFGSENHSLSAYCFVAGQKNKANQQRSFVFGLSNISDHQDSVLLGEGLKTHSSGAVIVGKYNANNSYGNALFIVGSGSDDTTRADAFIVSKGDIRTTVPFYIGGDIRSSGNITSISGGIAVSGSATIGSPTTMWSGYKSLSVGENNTIQVYKSAIIGANNTVNGGGDSFFVVGSDNVTSKSRTFLLGVGLKNSVDNDVVIIGRHNNEVSGAAFIIGNGEKSNNIISPSNALVIYKDGLVTTSRSTKTTDDDRALVTKDYVEDNIDDVSSSLLLANNLTQTMSEASEKKIKTITYTNPGSKYFYYSDLWVTCNGTYTMKYKITMKIKDITTNAYNETKTIYEGSGFNHIVFETQYSQQAGGSRSLNIIKRTGTALKLENSSVSLSADTQVEIYIEGTCAYLYKESGYDYYKF